MFYMQPTIIIVVIENLFLLVSNIKKYICDVLNSSLSFLKNYEKKTYNMLPFNVRLKIKCFLLL
jgi:hypothetical protein